MRSEIHELQKQVNEQAVQLPTSYVSKLDFEKFEDRVFDKLDKIESKVSSLGK